MSRTSLPLSIALLALTAVCAWAKPSAAALDGSAQSAFHSQVRIVRLSYTDGQVQFDRNDGQGFGQAFMNVPVVEGSQLSTGNSGHAEVEFEEGTTARLTPGTLITFKELRRDDSGHTQTLLLLDHGEAFFNVFNVRHKNEDFRVQAGSEVFSAVKESHFRVIADQNSATLGVFKGDVQLLMANGQKVAVKKNESLSIDFADADRYFLAQNVTSDPQDDWDSQRQSFVETQANSLAQYGNYINVNSYGTVWRPYGVAYDWNPYDAGCWVPYSNAGYVWVSSYPWGWAPYRYGAWNFIPGIGWAWQPGFNNWVWNTGPVIAAAPLGFVPPIPPRYPTGVVVVGNPPRPPIWHPRGGPNSYTSATSTASTGVVGTTISPIRPAAPIRVATDHSTPAETPRPVTPARSSATQTSRPVTPMPSAPSSPARSYTPPPAAQHSFSPPPQRSFSPPPAPMPSNSGLSAPARSGRNPR